MAVDIEPYTGDIVSHTGKIVRRADLEDPAYYYEKRFSQKLIKKSGVERPEITKVTTNFYMGCEQRCKFCYANVSDGHHKQNMDMRTRIRSIRKLYLLGVRLFELVGGNPTLDPNLLETLRCIKGWSGAEAGIISNSWGLNKNPNISNREETEALKMASFRTSSFSGGSAESHTESIGDHTGYNKNSFDTLVENMAVYSALGYDFNILLNINEQQSASKEIITLMRGLNNKSINIRQLGVKLIHPVNEQRQYSQKELNRMFRTMDNVRRKHNIPVTLANEDQYSSFKVKPRYRHLKRSSDSGISQLSLGYDGKLYCTSYSINDSDKALFGGESICDVSSYDLGNLHQDPHYVKAMVEQRQQTAKGFNITVS